MLGLLALLNLSHANDPAQLDRALAPVAQTLQQILDGEPAERVLQDWGLPEDELSAVTQRVASLPKTDRQGYALHATMFQGKSATGQQMLVLVAIANDGPPAIARVIVSGARPQQARLEASPGKRSAKILQRATDALEGLAKTLTGPGCKTLPLAQGRTYPAMGRFDHGSVLTQGDLDSFCDEVANLEALEPTAVATLWQVPFELPSTRALGLSFQLGQPQIRSNLDLVME